jgi:hypothetical protein
VGIGAWRSALALSGGATPDKANNPPPNETCNKAGCHTPAGGQGNGSVEVIGLPGCYVAGQTYNLKVRITDPDATRLRWGFEVGALYTEGNLWDNFSAGVIDNAAGARTQKVTSADTQRQFITHDPASANGDGTHPGAAGPMIEWDFQWTAPGATERQTQVCFYVAGLAGDNDESRAGDRTYTNRQCVQPCGPVGTHGKTWGEVKARYTR